jgi:hypothetical protein
MTGQVMRPPARKRLNAYRPWAAAKMLAGGMLVNLMSFMGKAQRRTSFGGLLSGFFAEVDEIVCYRDLGANVAEL